MSHSKGPWTACFSTLDGVPTDFHIAPYEYGTCQPVCESRVFEDGPFKITRAEHIANAHLIAAAPELLDNCIKALAAWEGTGPAILLDDLRACIAKATGEQS